MEYILKTKALTKQYSKRNVNVFIQKCHTEQWTRSTKSWCID